ncbi:hypothetical protein [Helicobacter sp. MIT 11-5569]|uniref:hypothetical protein n=1 Tax=Helicobacter sp. MIT 11-5569 TaxID=1548151 RepID=UPI000A9F535E|nr:hypothetical protein [Helicobacter sp. MIT 11-5569]
MREVVGGYRPFTASWYGHTYIQQPWTNNYNANKYPQTSNQAILSNAFMSWYIGK